jgi:cytochrome b561
MDGWQVVTVPWHLAGLRQPACNLFSFWYIHITLSHKSIGLSSLLLVAWRLLLAACRLSLASRFSTQ